MYEKAEEYTRNWSALGKARFYFYHSQHYYAHGLALWQDRQPDEAYRMMLEAEKSLRKDAPYVDKAQPEAAEAHELKIKNRIQFFKDTGIAH